MARRDKTPTEPTADEPGPAPAPTGGADERVVRPRTVRPGAGDDAGRVVRPRTVDALGPPRPIAARDLDAELRHLAPMSPDSIGSLGWEPPTGPVPFLIDPDQPVTGPGPVTLVDDEARANKPVRLPSREPATPPASAPSAPAAPASPAASIRSGPVTPGPTVAVAIGATTPGATTEEDQLRAVFQDDWDDIWTEDQAETALLTRTDELGTVDRELVTGDLVDRGEWADIMSFTGEVPKVPASTGTTRPNAAGTTAPDSATAAPATSTGGEHTRNLLRNNLFVASGTAVSRLTGLVRTWLILVLLVHGLGDAFINANNTPNMIYELILGGVLTATLVPLFTDDLERGRRDDATSAIISFSLVALLVVTLLALVVAPLLILLLSTGSPSGVTRTDYVHVGVRLSLLFAPQIFFYGLMAVWSAVLNARHRFLAAAWTPVLNNFVAIATLLIVYRRVGHHPTLADAVQDDSIVYILGIGTTLGIVLMALALYPSVRASGLRLKFRPSPKHPAVKKAIRLSGWTFGYVTANLVAVFIVNILAKPGTDGVVHYTTAYQFFQLPHGLLAVSIMTTFEPMLGRSEARGDRRAFNDQLLLGCRLIGLLVIPAAVGYIALPKGLDTRTFVASPRVEEILSVSGIVAAFAVGLPGFSSYLYSLRGFYAQKNTRTPFLINLFENAVNIVVAIVFVRIWGVVGLALAFSVAYTVAAIVSIAILRRHSPGFDWRALVNTWFRLLVAALIMGGAVYGVVGLIRPGSNLMLGAAVVAGIAVGAVVYFSAILAIGVQGIDDLFRRLPGLRRFSRA